MDHFTDFQIDLILAAGTVLGLILLIIIFRKFMVPRLLKYFAKNQATNSRIVVRQISSFISLWMMILALYILQQIFLEYLDTDQIVLSYLALRLLVAIAIIWFANRVIQESIAFYVRKGRLPPTTIFQNLTKIGIVALTITSLMYVMGFSIAPLLATIGVGGLAIALALQDTLSSLFAGIYILLSKQINPEDYVRLQSGEEGFIMDINWRNTTIRTRENNIIIVPNRSLSSLTIINFSLLSKEMSLVIPVGVHYNADLELAESLAIEVGTKVLAEIPGGVSDFIPLIRYNAFADSAITFNVILRIKEYTSQGLIRHNFIKQLRKKYQEFDITIPYPMRTLTFEEKLDIRRLEELPEA